jgi:hypothetical protein
MPKKYEFFESFEPLTEGKIDPILQMCIDEEKKGDPDVEVFYTMIGCGGKTTKIKENA